MLSQKLIIVHLGAQTQYQIIRKKETKKGRKTRVNVNCKWRSIQVIKNSPLNKQMGQTTLSLKGLTKLVLTDKSHSR